jgi:DNA polymerase family A
MRTKRWVRLWQDELGPFSPYRLDGNALFVAYANAAEYGTHLALGWGQPVNALDCLIEFKHLTNDGHIRAGDRPKGFYALPGAVQYFGGDAIAMATKNEWRDRIIQGPPFSNSERQGILDYCAGDVEMLAQLLPRLVPTIKSFPHAMQRAKFVWATAKHEHRGIPVNLTHIEQVRGMWQDIKVDLVREMDAPYGCYEIVDGQAHWRDALFAAYLTRTQIPWPRLDSGALDTKQNTFSDMAKGYAVLEDLSELRSTLSQLRLSKLAIGNDGRNRALLWPYGTKTGRNAPSGTGYIFGPAKWIRSFITPAPGRALVHRDYSQQEACIAAVLSGDPELLAACETGDVYLGIAKQLGFAPSDATTETHGDVRTAFKTVVLGIQYGLGALTLSCRLGISVYEAAEMLARLRARYRVFEEFAACVGDYAGLNLEISTCFGWTMKCSSGMRARTIRNFPIQATAAEILHVACVLAERRGIEIIAPVHDALMAECDLRDVNDCAASLDQCMRDAAAVVLQGYPLRTDNQIILPGGYYADKRGEKMYKAVISRIAKIESKHGTA